MSSAGRCAHARMAASHLTITTGQVSGTWIIGRAAASVPGILFYIMVDSVEASVAAVVQNCGEIVQKIGMDAPEITARFRDPGGNVIGLYQEPSR
jgi:predicted enzyme related to lactoylglutathione lyase